jgi:hypothetical protein
MNTATITGPIEKLEAIVEGIKENKMLETMVPIGEWDYGSAVDRWGTKWDLRDVEWDLDYTTQSLSLNFDSAWGPPTTAYDNYTDDNDDMHIEASYYESGMAFVGEYDSGLGIDMSHEVDFSDADWADNIPQNLIDDWGLDYEYEQWQEWNSEDEDDDE